MRLFLLTIFSAACVFPQTGPPDPLGRLREYLGLTDVQSTTILNNNAEYNRFVDEKQRRTFDVQREIAEKTAAEPLEPLELGLRYAEIETICRQLRDKANEIYHRNLTVLTDAQKTKMQALEEAAKLLPTYSEAQLGALAGPFTTAPFRLNTNSFGSTSLPLVSTVGAPFGCQNSFPLGRVVQTGILTSQPAP